MKRYGIIIAALTVVIGLMVFSSPEEFVKMMVIILGVGAFANGFFNLSIAGELVQNPYYKKDLLLRGWSSVGIGLIAVFLPLAFAATLWTVMLYVLAVYLLASAAFEIYSITKLKDTGINVKHYVFEAGISILLALFLIAVPGKIGLVLVRILGLALIISGISFAVFCYRRRDLIVEPDSVTDETEDNEDSDDEKADAEISDEN